MLKDGSYPATASGCVTKFKIGDKSFEGHGVRGVRGLNCQDVVTITNGVPSSNLLGDITKISLLIATPIYIREE
jgi:hypothetical protein